ncbi:Uncharacterised protein [Vibrio cholerae]|nr:Uncharacterised protein [Vibrio cholerae]
MTHFVQVLILVVDSIQPFFAVANHQLGNFLRRDGRHSRSHRSAKIMHRPVFHLNTKRSASPDFHIVRNSGIKAICGKLFLSVRGKQVS